MNSVKISASYYRNACYAETSGRTGERRPGRPVIFTGKSKKQTSPAQLRSQARHRNRFCVSYLNISRTFTQVPNRVLGEDLDLRWRVQGRRQIARVGRDDFF